MTKKISTVFIAVILVMMSFAVIMPMAAEALPANTELLVNGGFETIDPNRGRPEKWDCFGTWDGGSSTVVVSKDEEPENVYSGNYSAKMTMLANERSFVVQHFRREDIGEYKYRLSFVYKGNTGSNGFQLTTEQYRGDIHMGTSSVGTLTSTTEWKTVSKDFYAAADIDRISVVPQGLTVGVEVYFDDVSLMVVGGPEHPFKVTSDWVFYNEDYSEATINVKLHDFYENEGYTFDVVTKKGMKTYHQDKGIKLEGRSQEYIMDISGMDKKAQYLSTFNFKDKNGTVIDTAKINLYRIDRPTCLTKDGVYMVDGKPFDPIYVYHFDINDAEDAKKAGVNVVQWAPTDGTDKHKTLAELDLLHSKGLKAAVVCYWGMQPAGHPNNSARIQNFVQMIKDHPAVFSYMVMDEPFGQSGYTVDQMEEYLRTSYKIIRTIDDKHPVMLCENILNKMALSAKYVDILGIDPYPGNGSWETTVTDHAQAAVEATRGEKPVYALLQAFTFYGVKPTPEMLRQELYQAVMAGVNVVGYYPWLPDNPALDKVLNESEYWDTMVEFNEEAKSLLYSHFSRGESETYNIYRGNDIWYESWVSGGSLYVSVINRSTEESSSATVSLAGEKYNAVTGDYNVMVATGGQPTAITKNADSFIITIPRYHAAIYKIDSVGEGAVTGEDVSITIVSDGEEVKDAADIGNIIYANARNIGDGDRLYLAFYSGEKGNERLRKIAVATGTGLSAASCAVNDIPENITAVKVFLWTPGMGSVCVKEF